MQDPDFPHAGIHGRGLSQRLQRPENLQRRGAALAPSDDGRRARHPGLRRSAAPRAGRDHRGGTSASSISTCRTARRRARRSSPTSCKWLDALTRWLKVEAAATSRARGARRFQRRARRPRRARPGRVGGLRARESRGARGARGASPTSGSWTRSGISSSRRSRSAGGTTARAPSAGTTACAST